MTAARRADRCSHAATLAETGAASVVRVYEGKSKTKSTGNANELSVQGENAGATRLYESVGMSAVWTIERWEKTLQPHA